MLAAARRRLVAVAGTMPALLVLLQADASTLPFAASSFGTVLCPELLHLIENCEALTRELARAASDDAAIFVSSLMVSGVIGRRYLDLRHRAGEVAAPQPLAELATRLNAPSSGLQAPITLSRIDCMAFVQARPARRAG